MITRFIPSLFLSASLFAPSLQDLAAQTIQLIVPSYDYTPGHAYSTIAADIANDGNIVGGYANSRFPENGYLRLSNGRFRGRIIVPGANFTTVTGINTAGLICGSWLTDVRHGFFFDGASYTQFDLPGNEHTYIEGINDAGDFVGKAIDPRGVHTQFISLSGVISTFSIPGISDSEVVVRGINNLGQVTGYYLAGIAHGYLREADGTLTYPIDYPVAGASTEILGLNDQGALVGFYDPPVGDEHAFVLKDGVFISYDHPDGSATSFGGINNLGMICGTYADANRDSHGFVARLK
jgi:uncharacterized membrane protein